MELEAATKRARASGGSSPVPGEPDRLSALPDCLLHAIMSFMKARQVVQTCMLSTRWKDLWRSVPCLDLDVDEFKDDENSDSDNDDRNWKWQHFEDFSLNLMLRRNIALLDSFRLHVRRVASVRECVPSWLRRAIKYCAPDPSIQREGLGSSSWRMKRLHLCNILLDNRFAKHVIFSCHSLEDLELISCRCKFRTITSHSLKNLVLKYCSCIGVSDITSPTLSTMSPTLSTLVIDGWRSGHLGVTAPTIAYLCLTVQSPISFFYAVISLNEMPSLDKASILLPANIEGVAKTKCADVQFNLLCSLSNVTCLELSNWVTMVLNEESTTFKQFKNLRNLLLDNCDLGDDFKILTLFLENSPNMEKLTLRLCKFTNDSKKKKGTPKSKKASCSEGRSLDVQCASLKLTEIMYKDDDVRELVELLLRISGNLPENHLKLRKVD